MAQRTVYLVLRNPCLAGGWSSDIVGAYNTRPEAEAAAAKFAEKPHWSGKHYAYVVCVTRASSNIPCRMPDLPRG